MKLRIRRELNVRQAFCTLQVSLFKLSDGEHHGISQLGGQHRVAGAELQGGRGGVRGILTINHSLMLEICRFGTFRHINQTHLINDFSKLLQSGAHHLIIAPERKTLQTTATQDNGT